jgi:hypothetical protein
MADVVVPVPALAGSRIAAVSQSVSDFEAALRSTVVAQRVSAETGLPVIAIEDGLESQQLLGGSLVEVRYTSSDFETARHVVSAASSEALALLLQGQRAPVEVLKRGAQAGLDRANEAYAEFLTTNDLLDPALYFKVQSKRLIDLQDEANRLRAEGKEVRAEEIEADIERRQDNLVPLQLDYTLLQESRATAIQAQAEANAAFAAADAAVEAAREGGSVRLSDPVPIPRATQMFRRLLIAVVVATALTIGLVILLELAPPGGVARVLSSSADGSRRVAEPEGDPETETGDGRPRRKRAPRPSAQATDHG